MLEKYNREKAEINESLNRIEQLIYDIETNDSYRIQLLRRHKELAIDVENLMKNEYPIAVLANWNAGKSTFLNALLGREILPMRNKSYTSEITRIRYGEDPKILINYVDGQTEEILLTNDLERDFLVKYVTVDGNESRENKVEEVVIEYPLELCKEGIVLIDTPGVNSINDLHDGVTYRVIPNSKAIIMLVTADSPGGKDEVQFLKRILTGRDKEDYDIFFVINKADSISKEDLEDAIASVERAIAEVKDDDGAPLIENPQIMPVSSYVELMYQLYKNNSIDFDELSNDVKLYYKNHRGRRQPIKNPEDTEQLKGISNFQKLRQTLNDAFMNLDTTKRLLFSTKSGLLNLCFEDILKYLNKTKKSLTNDQQKSVEQVEKEIEHMRVLMVQAQKSKDSIVASFEKEMEEVIDDYVERVQDDWRNSVIYDVEMFIKASSLKELKEDGSTIISNEFKRCIQREYYNTSQKMSKRVEKIVDKHVLDYKQMIQKTDEQFEKIGNYDLVTEPSGINYSISPFKNSIKFGLSDTNRMMVTGGMAWAGAQVGVALGSIVPGIGNIIGGLLGGIIGGLFGFFGLGPSESKVKRDIVNKVKPSLKEQCDKAFQNQRTSMIDSIENMKSNSIQMFNKQFEDYKLTIENSYQDALRNMKLREEEHEELKRSIERNIERTNQIIETLTQEH